MDAHDRARAHADGRHGAQPRPRRAATSPIAARPIRWSSSASSTTRRTRREAADAQGGAPRWGVGEHTDYGLLTILKQDDAGGLEVKSRTGWVPAPPVPGSFVCNIGDMLDRMTGGLYRSTPHRVRNLARRARLSFPFFFDPAFDARIQPIEMPDAAAIARRSRRAVGPRQRARVRRHLWRLRAGQGGEGLSPAAPGGRGGELRG